MAHKNKVSHVEEDTSLFWTLHWHLHPLWVWHQDAQTTEMGLGHAAVRTVHRLKQLASKCIQVFGLSMSLLLCCWKKYHNIESVLMPHPKLIPRSFLWSMHLLEAHLVANELMGQKKLAPKHGGLESWTALFKTRHLRKRFQKNQTMTILDWTIIKIYGFFRSQKPVDVRKGRHEKKTVGEMSPSAPSHA